MTKHRHSSPAPTAASAAAPPCTSPATASTSSSPTARTPTRPPRVVAEVDALGRRAVALQLDVADVAASTPSPTPCARRSDALGPRHVRLPRQQRRLLARRHDRRRHRGRRRRARRRPLQGRAASSPRRCCRCSPTAARSSTSPAASPASPRPQRAVYGAVKGAVEVLTRYLAAELGPRGITANVIAPGPVATDFSDGMLRDTPEVQEHLAAHDRARADRGRRRHRRRDRQPPAPGNDWITGQRIEVSGGIHS